MTVNSSGVSAGGIEFDTSGYSLTGAAISLTSNNNSGWQAGEIRANSPAAIDAALAGSVGMTKTGTGTLTLTGVSTFDGDTAIQNGTLAVAGGSDRLPTGTAVTLGSDAASGMLQLGDGTTSCNQTLSGLFTSGSGTSNRVVGGGSNVGTLMLGSMTGYEEYDGILGGPGTNQNNLALAMETSAIVVLTGDNSYAGGTFVDNGLLEAWQSNTALGTGTIHLGGGGLGGLATLANPIVVSDGCIRVAGTLTLNGDISSDPSNPGALGCTNLLNDYSNAGILQLGGDNSGYYGIFDE